jgi:hypothetical protein
LQIFKIVQVVGAVATHSARGRIETSRRDVLLDQLGDRTGDGWPRCSPADDDVREPRGGDDRGMRRAPIRGVGVAAAALMTGCALVTGCASDKPPVCDSVDAVRHSADQLRSANISENGLSAVSGDLSQLKADLAQFASDAKAQYQPQVDSLKASVDRLQSNVTSAKESPTAVSLGAVRTALTDVGDAARELRAAVAGTC